MIPSLLSRLQSLTGPDREVDAEIALACGWKRVRFEQSWKAPDGSIRPGVPLFTADIHAALTLKPSHLYWHAGCHAENDAVAAVFTADDYENDGAEWIEGNTPAIALLIAIMKAKEDHEPK